MLVLLLAFLSGCGVLYYKMPEAHLDPAEEVALIKAKLLQEGVDTLVTIHYLYQNTYVEPIGPRPKMPIDLYWKSAKGKYWLMKISTYRIVQSEVSPLNLSYFNKGHDTILYPPSYYESSRGVRGILDHQNQKVQLDFQFAGNDFNQTVIRLEGNKHPIQVFLNQKDAKSTEAAKESSNYKNTQFKRQWVWKE